MNFKHKKGSRIRNLFQKSKKTYYFGQLILSTYHTIFWWEEAELLKLIFRIFLAISSFSDLQVLFVNHIWAFSSICSSNSLHKWRPAVWYQENGYLISLPIHRSESFSLRKSRTFVAQKYLWNSRPNCLLTVFRDFFLPHNQRTQISFSEGTMRCHFFP